MSIFSSRFRGVTLLAPDRKGTTGLFGKHGQKRPQGLHDGEGQHTNVKNVNVI